MTGSQKQSPPTVIQNSLSLIFCSGDARVAFFLIFPVHRQIHERSHGHPRGPFGCVRFRFFEPGRAGDVQIHPMASPCPETRMSPRKGCHFDPACAEGTRQVHSALQLGDPPCRRFVAASPLADCSGLSRITTRALRASRERVGPTTRSAQQKS
jgi:hypothetical protein